MHTTASGAGAEPVQIRIAPQLPAAIEPNQTDMMDVFAGMLAQKLDVIQKGPPNLTTLGEFFDRYITTYAEIHTKTAGDLRKHFRLYLLPWRDRRLTEIRRADIVALQRSMVDGGKSEHACNRMVELLCLLYNRAIEWEVFKGDNPARHVKKFRLRSRNRFLQPNEITRYIDAAKSLTHQTSSDYFLMLLYTGQRRTNVAEMRWADISFEREVWHIPLTKNGTSHNVPLTSQALEILGRRHSADDKHDEWVFPQRDGSGPIRWLHGAWRSILRDSGIQNLRMHDLRRSHASWMAISNVSSAIIGAMLNHQDPRSTMIYARLNVEPVREAMQAACDSMTAGQVESPDTRKKRAALKPVSKPAALPSHRKARRAADIKLTAKQQAVIESKILKLVDTQPRTKTQLWGSLSGFSRGFTLNGLELQRTLEEMIGGGLIERSQGVTANGYGVWQYSAVRVD